MNKEEVIEILIKMYDNCLDNKSKDALEYAIIIVENSDCHVLVQDMRKGV